VGYRSGVLAPMIFILLAILTAGTVAYGSHPGWGAWQHGLDIIYFTRRLQWPLLTASLVFCVALIGLVAAGKRRAWWLLGLAPVLALFGHRFLSGPTANWRIVEDPAFVDASEALSVGDGDYVVGLIFGDQSFAYPYSAIFSSPVIIQSDREKRLLLIWNAFANKATARQVGRAFKARDLDLVSSPANGLIIYNSRYGQFINGMTGLTEKGTKPTDVGAPIATEKMPWGTWHTLHPHTKVLLPGGPKGLTQPLAPAFSMPKRIATEPRELVTVIATTQPVAVVESGLPVDPVILDAGETKVLLLPAAVAGVPTAFDRQVKDDLFPTFSLADAKPGAARQLIDSDSRSLWTLTGRAIAGPLKGERLRPIDVESGLNFQVMKFWFPDLKIVQFEIPSKIQPPPEPPAATKPPRRRRR
jgi:hypothetical protein